MIAWFTGQTVTWAREKTMWWFDCRKTMQQHQTSFDSGTKAHQTRKPLYGQRKPFKRKISKVTESDSRYFDHQNPIWYEGNFGRPRVLSQVMSKKSLLALQMIVLELWIGNNQSITQGRRTHKPYSSSEVEQGEIQLLPDVSIGYWDDFKSKFVLKLTVLIC